MSTVNECCEPCSFTPPTQVPGAPGDDGAPGAAGANGINAFTFTTAGFVIPTVGANVTVSVVDSSWMAVGQNVFVAGPANFSVASKPNATSVILTFLGYKGDEAVGSTISAGAQVSPAGVQGPDHTMLPTVSSYVLGGSQSLTDSSVQLLTNSATLAVGTYLLLATVRLDFANATIGSSRTITLKLREVTNGPADVANAIAHLETGTPTAANNTLAVVPMPPVQYTAAANDKIEIFGMIDTAGSGDVGDVDVIEASILAIKLF